MADPPWRAKGTGFSRSFLFIIHDRHYKMELLLMMGFAVWINSIMKLLSDRLLWRCDA